MPPFSAGYFFLIGTHRLLLAFLFIDSPSLQHCSRQSSKLDRCWYLWLKTEAWVVLERMERSCRSGSLSGFGKSWSEDETEGKMIFPGGTLSPCLGERNMGWEGVNRCVGHSDKLNAPVSLHMLFLLPGMLYPYPLLFYLQPSEKFALATIDHNCLLQPFFPFFEWMAYMLEIWKRMYLSACVRSHWVFPLFFLCPFS